MMYKTLSSIILCAAAALGAAQGKVVLGKLGQTTEKTKIFAAPNSRARVYYTAKAFEYLVVRTSEKPAYLKVLLQNGVYGYVPKDDIAQLPYEVTADAPASKRSGGRQAGTLTSRTGSALAQYSLNFLGTPYKWGGNDVYNGIDCSAFVKKMYGKVGVNLPRTAAEQALVGKPITMLEHLQPGDRLYFWDAKRNKIGHTGIYMGGGYFVHSSSGRKGVATDFLSDKWKKILVAARR